jgi:ATP-dependent helicase Lhr and Lhr-like helicase
VDDPQTLRHQLPRTWGAFFGRHGNFTVAQRAAIPPLLAGENVVIGAATASGKTEAALAPLVERHLPPQRPSPQLTLLYLLPTRALINDLAARLHPIFDTLRIAYAVKSRDLTTFNPKSPPDILFTTPESLDSLLCGETKTLIHVQAVVIDELHIFDGTVRGDQLRVLLNRLRQVREYAFQKEDTANDTIQYVALSATLAQPAASAVRYFPAANIIKVPGKRDMQSESIPLDPDSPDALLDSLATFRQRGWRKALVFCNTRAEIEAYAATVRARGSAFGHHVYVHYSNLEPQRRHEIEQQFAQAEVGLCFASSTLELGIDVGSIDAVLMVGAPGNAASFMQRLGRANRRRQTVSVICFYRSPLERIMFEALANMPASPTAAPFRPSVAIQQIFSLLRQSPNAALRFNPLTGLLPLAAPDVTMILGQLQAAGYLTQARMGEWRAGERLNRLIDLQSSDQTPLSIHSNIQTSTQQVKIRDQHSHQIIAKVDAQWFNRDTFTLEGRRLNVEWYDGEVLWVSRDAAGNPMDKLFYRSGRQILSFELAQQIAAQMGLAAGMTPHFAHEGGFIWFHWLGDLYGRVLLELVQYTRAAADTSQPGLCLLLDDELPRPPHWTPEQVTRHIADHFQKYESLLNLGAYHAMLPRVLRRRAVIEQFDIPRFVQILSSMQLETSPASSILMSLVR